MKGLFVLAYAITNLHPGAGRGYGIVDLPVQRDQLGYPIIYSSAFKGPLKALCAGNSLNDNGRINCNEKPECCCLFGSEPEEEESSKGVLDVLDLPLFSLPAPNTQGFMQVTTEYLINRTKNIFNTILELNSYLGTLGNEISNLLNSNEGKDGTVYGNRVRVTSVSVSILKQLPLFTEKLGIADDRKVVDKSLIIYTRNRLNLLSKVVSGEGLWSEEYVPMGSIFIGGMIIDENSENRYCGDLKKKYCDNLLFLPTLSTVLHGSKVRDDVYSFYLNIGGKESIGKGFVKVFIGV
ncbi:type III-B CRISPR module RAMP protein Cmr4 [Acidianus sp. HS-5]|uniref:type III-B CRISPR module RAMP protein Cmr4 n=1 Tax=Acidianus sp. HS-5 TaxID=2886040 RepID=UPI001EFF9192|nr:type III-B CRISPR module RAMP protein Cmr4 [Acidianus sp. HS-5]BDC18771.1 type III-B CRISPR module RAMP protein Cmr4 [Acidianus sp. HS-5]